MKKICIYLLCLGMFMGCATTTVAKSKPKYFADQAIWVGKEKYRVYDYILMTLQTEGFGIYPMGTNRESGIIVTETVSFYPIGWNKIKGYYKLQILVSELENGKIIVNISPKGGYRADPDVLSFNKEEVQNAVNNKLSDDLNSLFDSLEKLLGKPEYIRRDRQLIWK